MTETTATMSEPLTSAPTPAGSALLEALASRDFDRLSDCFEPSATMRAMLPSGPTEVQGADQIIANMKIWFGSADEFEVLHARVDEVGGRPHVTWRLRMHPTPWGDDAWHVIEQQAYLQAGERIAAIDLLCSGFQPDVLS